MFYPLSCGRTMSHLLGMHRAIQLKIKYEQQQGFQYCAVLVSRWDVLWMSAGVGSWLAEVAGKARTATVAALAGRRLGLLRRTTSLPPRAHRLNTTASGSLTCAPMNGVRDIAARLSGAQEAKKRRRTWRSRRRSAA